MDKSIAPDGVSANERNFVKEYLKHGNARQAYLNVFACTKNTAAKSSKTMMKRPRVREYMRIQMEKIDKEELRHATVDKSKVMYDLDTLREIAVRERQLGPAVRATELMGKELGMFRERTDISVHKVSDEALIQAISTQDESLGSELARVLNIEDYKKVASG